jgi:hypothetical protein
VKWTLAPAAGTQLVTVTSSAVTGVSVAFVATNGATVTGVVHAGNVSPFANFSLSPSRGSRLSKSLSSSRTVSRRLSPNRIVVGFNNNTLGLAAAGTSAYRSMTTARAAVSRMQQSLTSFSRALPISDAQISPAMLAARVLVTDPAQIENVMAELRKQSDVAWVERDEVISIRDGAPRPMSAEFTRVFADRIVPSDYARNAKALVAGMTEMGFSTLLQKGLAGPIIQTFLTKANYHIQPSYLLFKL